MSFYSDLTVVYNKAAESVLMPLFKRMNDEPNIKSLDDEISFVYLGNFNHLTSWDAYKELLSAVKSCGAPVKFFISSEDGSCSEESYNDDDDTLFDYCFTHDIYGIPNRTEELLDAALSWIIDHAVDDKVELCLNRYLSDKTSLYELQSLSSVVREKGAA